MLRFFVRRSLIAVATMFAISVVSFVIIQLPPGDFLTSYAAQLRQEGEYVEEEELEGTAEGTARRR